MTGLVVAVALRKCTQSIHNHKIHQTYNQHSEVYSQVLGVSYLVLQVGVAEGRDEDPCDAGVAVPGRGVQRGVAVLRRKEQNIEVQLNSLGGWLVEDEEKISRCLPILLKS